MFTLALRKFEPVLVLFALQCHMRNVMLHFNMKKIERQKAKELLAKSRIKLLQESERLQILETSYYFLDRSYCSDDDNFEEYIEELIRENGNLPTLNKQTIKLIKDQEYLNQPFNKGLEPIFLEALIDELYGVTNDYIENLLNKEEKPNFKVIGEVEKMGTCPCCEYNSIGYGEDGFCDICTICFWENGPASANHMSLVEARKNFQELGAISKDSLKFIDPAGKIKYKKNEA